jgi:hypothetical protein
MRDRITAAAVNNKYEYLWAKNYGTKSFITVKYWYKYIGLWCPFVIEMLEVLAPRVFSSLEHLYFVSS